MHTPEPRSSSPADSELPTPDKRDVVQAQQSHGKSKNTAYTSFLTSPHEPTMLRRLAPPPPPFDTPVPLSPDGSAQAIPRDDSAADHIGTNANASANREPFPAVKSEPINIHNPAQYPSAFPLPSTNEGSYNWTSTGYRVDTFLNYIPPRPAPPSNALGLALDNRSIIARHHPERNPFAGIVHRPPPRNDNLRLPSLRELFPAYIPAPQPMSALKTGNPRGEDLPAADRGEHPSKKRGSSSMEASGGAVKKARFDTSKGTVKTKTSV